MPQKLRFTSSFWQFLHLHLQVWSCGGSVQTTIHPLESEPLETKAFWFLYYSSEHESECHCRWLHCQEWQIKTWYRPQRDSTMEAQVWNEAFYSNDQIHVWTRKDECRVDGKKNLGVSNWNEKQSTIIKSGYFHRSIPAKFRPLPDRFNLIVTNQSEYDANADASLASVHASPLVKLWPYLLSVNYVFIKLLFLLFRKHWKAWPTSRR